MAGHGRSDRNLGAGIKLILEEIRDMRAEMLADRRQADAERRLA